MDKTFWQQHGDEISAAITVVVAVLIAFGVDRLVIGRGARAIGGDGVSRAAHTRLQVVRRLIFVAIVLIGVALALSQFAQIKRLATGILASSAVIGLVIGFAARQTFANPIAGLLLAITQPVRIGDRVTIEGETGRIDDLTLTYTYIDTGDGRLMVIPNEQMIGSALFNHSTGDQSAPVTASAWLPPGADLATTRRVLEDAGVTTVRLAEWTPDGIRLEMRIEHGAEYTRAGEEESALRERAQQALASAGLTAQA
jgi:small-conductance mechanosensitive channel